MRLRHRKRRRPSVRGITSRRLAAARRALARERKRYALFAEQVGAEQPTPEERISAADLAMLDYDQGHRELSAKHWRWGRRQLERYPEVVQDILQKWNRSWIPDDATYFADFVRTELRARGLTVED